MAYDVDSATVPTKWVGFDALHFDADDFLDLMSLVNWR